jgi:hypothetical protein
MKQWEYEQLQSELTKKMQNNPYGRTANFKRNVRMDTKKGFLQRRAFFIISINGKEVQKSE